MPRWRKTAAPADLLLHAGSTVPNPPTLRYDAVSDDATRGCGTVGPILGGGKVDVGRVRGGVHVKWNVGHYGLGRQQGVGCVPTRCRNGRKSSVSWAKRESRWLQRPDGNVRSGWRGRAGLAYFS